MNRIKYPLVLVDGTKLMIGDVTWDKIYKLEQSRRFEEILDHWFKYAQDGLPEKRKMLAAIECIYVGYLCEYYEEGKPIKEFPEFLMLLDTRRNNQLFVVYNLLFGSKKN